MIDASELDNDVVRVGSQVHVKDERRQVAHVHDRRLHRGGSRQQALSNESPVGKALIGRKKGDDGLGRRAAPARRKLKITKIDVA